MMRLDPPPPRAPLPLRLAHSDEFAPVPLEPFNRVALWRTLETAQRAARRLRVSAADYLASRLGTAAALAEINRVWGEEFYAVPPAAAEDAEAAREAFGGPATVVDVQTHYVAQERRTAPCADAILGFIRSVAPERWRDLQGGEVGLSISEYLRCVFLESETAVAVLTSAPGEGENNILTAPEIEGTRQLVDRLAGSGRLLHHAIVHPNLAGELDALETLVSRRPPDGLKVYTLYGSTGPRSTAAGAARATGWMLDDDETGMPFLERCRALGVRRVCAHKGLSFLAPTGSPADVGPAAAAYPEIDLLVYHSGYETEGPEEGPYREEGPALGTDRLVRSLREAGVAPGSNVYAELGSTWFALMRHPREAAHVLGKLLHAVGPDNVLWGTDSIWYGSSQPLIDAFRAFQIPASMRERWSYPELTPQLKAKILGANAARVYGIDLDAAAAAARNDDLSWVRDALDEVRDTGTPRALR